MFIRLGTRGSQLARTQSESVAEALRCRGHEVDVVVIRTEGDINMKPLSQLGGVGVFAAALRLAILEGDIDIAVHSLKDLPTAPVEGLTIAAIPPREDPGDVLIGGGLTLDELPPGARVGTGSPRRAAQLLARRGDLTIVDIRGNVDTRMRFVTDGELDAVVLAAAGLRRLGRLAPDHFPLDLWPAPAQGALAIECRSGDAELRGVLADLDDAATRFAAEAERAVLATLGAGCAAPVGVRTSSDGSQAKLEALVASPDGVQTVTASALAEPGMKADELGRLVAGRLVAAGAGDVVDLAATAPSKLANLHD
ncbi:MAG: hydroxymethylbilane synthase [Propionibacteriaceae bacterium]|nr:hydroxymethylbilane synthase [Propionibacteriaceae bacterium]